MTLLEQLEQDRGNLAAGLEQMTAQFEQLGRRIQQQAGALQYADMLIERVKGEDAAAAPPPLDAPDA